MGCCCSIKNPSQQILGRQVVCPRCERIFPAITTNYAFNEHLDNCLTNTQVRQISPEEYKGILYWEKIPQGSNFTWVQKEYDPNQEIDENNITKCSFGAKQIWFRIKLEKLRIPWQNGCTTLLISQNKLLESSIEQILKLKSRLLHGEIKIKFQEDTKVQDAGGLLREWSTSVLQQVVRLGFLMKTYTDELSYRLNPTPTGGDQDTQTLDKRQLFTFIGILIGKCLFERITLSSYLDRTLIRHILGQKVNLEDMVHFDSELYLSWQYMLKNDVESLILNFTLENNGQTIHLKPNGDEIKVQTSNMKEFIDLCVAFYSTKVLEPYLQDFLTGLYQVIPKFLLSVFQPEELEMMLFGLPFIDIADWQQNTVYKDCYSDENHIIWFWEVLKLWNQEQLGRFLRFCTGSSRVPVEGFGKLESNRGEIAIFCIQSPVFEETDPYPKAHTCFNRLELPKYLNKQQLEMYLNATLNENLQGQFGLE